VNKSGLIDAVSQTTSLAKRDAEDAVNALLHIVSSEVRSGRRVVVAGFGSFNPTHRGPRLGRNPQTGAPVRVGATRGVRFAASATFKDVLNGKSALGTLKVARRPANGRSAHGVAGRASGKAGSAKNASSTRPPARRPMGGPSKASTKKAVPVTAGRATKKVVGRAPARKAATRAPARKAARQSARKAAGRPPAKRASQRSAKKAVRRA